MICIVRGATAGGGNTGCMVGCPREVKMSDQLSAKDWLDQWGGSRRLARARFHGAAQSPMRLAKALGVRAEASFYWHFLPDTRLVSHGRDPQGISREVARPSISSLMLLGGRASRCHDRLGRCCCSAFAARLWQFGERGRAHLGLAVDRGSASGGAWAHRPRGRLSLMSKPWLRGSRCACRLAAWRRAAARGNFLLWSFVRLCGAIGQTLPLGSGSGRGGTSRRSCSRAAPLYMGLRGHTLSMRIC